MGMCASAPENPEEHARDVAVTRQIKEDARRSKEEFKLLLLGAGESGKSTIFKQLKIIYHDGFTPKECLQYKGIIYANILQSMRVLIGATQKMNIPIEEANRERAARIMGLSDAQLVSNSATIMTPALGDDIARLWRDPGIQTAFRHRNQFQLNDSAEYYFNEIGRISMENFIPTQQDVLRSRVKTVGITEEEFEIQTYKFRIFDVGGQRTERRKWIHVFDDVTAIIFVTSLSEFDQKLMEDESTNRMEESLSLFSEIANHRLFARTPIIIFFNKTDLFERKMRDADLSQWFPEYKGGRDTAKAKEFIEKLFLARNLSEGRPIYTDFTCATDTNTIRTVFDATKDIIIRRALDLVNL